MVRVSDKSLRVRYMVIVMIMLRVRDRFGIVI